MNGDSVAWLPPLILFADNGGDWDTYLESVYQVFVTDFVDDKPCYLGKRLGLKRHPVVEGKEATFWHMISEGVIEKDRIPDFRRMERICWPKPIIENTEEREDAPVVKVWRNLRSKNDSRILLWVESEQYLVVLADRGKYILPWTAYQVTRGHQQRKLQKEYEKYWESIG
ncbi:hypothetical protein [Ketobacter sp.]